MGTATFSTWVKALSGTWPPVGNTVEEAMAPPPIAVLVSAAPDALAAEVAAELVLPGPCARAALDEPPATRPAAVVEDPAPVRINRLRRDRKSVVQGMRV